MYCKGIICGCRDKWYNIHIIIWSGNNCQVKAPLQNGKVVSIDYEAQ